MTNSEPTLVVERERIDVESGRVYVNGATTAVDSQTVERLVFVPQFQPSTLTDEQRRLYDGLREFHDEGHGALVGASESADKTRNSRQTAHQPAPSQTHSRESP